MGELLILAEHIADLTTAYADVASRNVLVRTDVTIKLVHESLTETHHLSIALATRREVGTALGASHRQRGERILEGLLEGKELKGWRD